MKVLKIKDEAVSSGEQAQILSQHLGDATGTITGMFIGVQSIRNARIHVNLNIAQHGVLWQPTGAPNPASIVSFRLICDTKDTRTRFESLVVDAELESMNSTSKPSIHKYSPVRVIGESTRMKKVAEAHSALTLGGGLLPASVDVGLSGSHSSRHVSQFELEAISSSPHSISWILKENTCSKGGIPTNNDFALLVETHGNFTIRLSFKARLSPSYHPTSWIGMRSCRTAVISILLKKKIGLEIEDGLLADMDKIELGDYVVLQEC